MKALLKQYQAELKRTRKMKEAAATKEDAKIITGMITDLETAISWMKTGRPPGDFKGVYGATNVDPVILSQIPCRSAFAPTVDPLELVENRIDKEMELQHA